MKKRFYTDKGNVNNLPVPRKEELGEEVAKSFWEWIKDDWAPRDFVLYLDSIFYELLLDKMYEEATQLRCKKCGATYEDLEKKYPKTFDMLLDRRRTFTFCKGNTNYPLCYDCERKRFFESIKEG